MPNSLPTPLQSPGDSWTRLRGLVPWLLLLLTLVVWAPALRLPFTGEDLWIFARLGAGEAGMPLVFRPFSELWLQGLHAAFGGASSMPFHLGSLALHLCATLLVFRVSLELFECRWIAGLSALAMGIGVGASESLIWIAAINRGLSGVGMLLAFWGVLRLLKRGRWAYALLFGGLCVQWGSNEEFYGSVALCCALIFVAGWRDRPAQQRASVVRHGLALGACVALVLLRHFVFEQREVGAKIPDFELLAVMGAVGQRSRDIIQGLGIPVSSLGGATALPLLAILPCLRRRCGKAALLCLGLFGASFVPFALSEPSPYRAYPTLAPIALLLGAGLVSLWPANWPKASKLGFMALLACALIGATLPLRRERFRLWRAALQEVEACNLAAREMATTLQKPPVLINLEHSSIGPFFYHFKTIDLKDVEMHAFLDTPLAFEEPGAWPPGPWWGRRADDSLGWVEREVYQTRPRVAPLIFYSRAQRVDSLEAARLELAHGQLDIRGRALWEADQALIDQLNASPLDNATMIQITRPFEQLALTAAAMDVRVKTEHAALLVYQEHWVFDALYHASPDQALFTGNPQIRRVAMDVTDRASGELLTTYAVNAFGLGVLVPAGEHDLQLRWRLARADAAN